MENHVSSVIRRRVMVASSMFTRRAGALSAEARRAGATECGSRLGGPEQKLGSRARAGSAQARRLEDARHCLFIAPALSRITKSCPRCAAVNSHIAPFSSIRSASA